MLWATSHNAKSGRSAVLAEVTHDSAAAARMDSNSGISAAAPRSTSMASGMRA
jgi:hypothetical protein